MTHLGNEDFQTSLDLKAHQQFAGHIVSLRGGQPVPNPTCRLMELLMLPNSDTTPYEGTTKYGYYEYGVHFTRIRELATTFETHRDWLTAPGHLATGPGQYL